MRRLFLCGLVLLSAVAAAAASDPRTLISQTADTLIGVIKEGKTYFDKDPQRFYASVEKVLNLWALRNHF